MPRAVAHSGTLRAAAISCAFLTACASQRHPAQLADAGAELANKRTPDGCPPDASQPDAGQPDAAPHDTLLGLSGAFQLSAETPSGTVGPAPLYLIGSDASDWLALLDGQLCEVTREPEGMQLSGCLLFADSPPNRAEHSGPVLSSFALKRVTPDRWSEQLIASEQRTGTVAPARIERSRRAPALHLAYPWVPYLTARPRLPWDILAVTFGRGVGLDGEHVSRDLKLASADGRAHTARWLLSAVGTDDGTVAAAFGARTTLDWRQLDGKAVTLSLPAGTPDLAGNRTARELKLEVQLARTGAPARGWDFEAETLPSLASWGGPRIVQRTRVCEGSCLQLGPNITACGEPGIAGQLDTRGASKLLVRVRAQLASDVYAPLAVEVYLGEPQGAPLEPALEHTFVTAPMTDVPPRDTDWVDLELPLSAAYQQPDLPFELRVSYHCPTALDAGRTPASATKSAVLVDHVRVQ